MRAVLFSVAVSGVAAQTSPPNYDMLWNNWKMEYGFTSNDIDEENKRFAIFKENVDFIYATNAKGLSYTLGLNQFSHLTSDEFSSQYMGYKMPTDMYGDAPFLGNHTWNGEELADAVDWTQKNAVTPVKNQGHCGSCWAFSTTGAIEGAYAISSGKLVSISEQQLVDCDGSDLGCKGGSMNNGFNFAKANDMCTESSYKYESGGTQKKGSCRSSGCTVGVPKATVTGYKGLAAIPRLIPASLNTMMSAVQQQPVSVAIEADKKIFQSYKSGVLSDAACGTSLDHGVLVVGYGSDAKYGDYWKVKNSWGTTYGEAGYIRLGRAGGRGECGILLSPSYPVVSSTSTVVV